MMWKTAFASPVSSPLLVRCLGENLPTSGAPRGASFDTVLHSHGHTKNTVVVGINNLSSTSNTRIHAGRPGGSSG